MPPPTPLTVSLRYVLPPVPGAPSATVLPGIILSSLLVPICPAPCPATSLPLLPLTAGAADAAPQAPRDPALPLPLSWSHYFDAQQDVHCPERGATFHVYTAGALGPAVEAHLSCHVTAHWRSACAHSGCGGGAAAPHHVSLPAAQTMAQTIDYCPGCTGMRCGLARRASAVSDPCGLVPLHVYRPAHGAPSAPCPQVAAAPWCSACTAAATLACLGPL